MIKKYLILLLSINLFQAVSQNFEALPYIGNKPAPYYIEKVLVDSIHDKLLISSKWINYAGSKKVRGVCSWDGSIWDSLSSGINTHDILNNQPNGNILAGISYNGKFLVGGNFESIGGVNATSIATWDGTKWDSLPIRAFKFLDYGASIYGFYKYNGNLYLYGYFDSIQGQKANGLASFDGVSFHPINLPIQNQSSITDMILYNGELYISGVFSYTAQAGNQNILKYDGTNWISVGGGVKGNISSISSMTVYNNELYVGGYFLKSSGNIANIIMKWNGTNWKDVGWGNEYNNGGIWKLLIYKNKLFTFGTFDLAGNIKASKIAVFDGIQWCNFSDSLDSDINTAAIYRDTIYVAGNFKSINTDTTKKLIAKLKYPNNYVQCVNASYNEFIKNIHISVNPIPTNSVINIIVEQNQFLNSIIEIINYLGQSIFSEPFTNQIDVSHFPSGVYTINIKTINGELYHAKFLRE